ncbi:MAG: endonuclease III [Planctomycetota bacterium]|nr:endonuclease III [Planctomycetota bacterium]MEC8252640.1 endonuclease III [Planctomycetota bacterium]MEC8652276.1 endonuclease III [Planctomycetota bacterium]MEC9047794.1 endonuclease III [Planctomycetota bacterium]
MATKKASGDKAKKGGAKKVAKKAQKKATKHRRPAAAVVAPPAGPPPALPALLARLERAIPTPRCELDHRDGWTLLIATILSAQSTDKMINTVTPALFERWPTPEALASAPREEVEQAVHRTGFFRNKAKAIQGASLAIHTEHGGEVPRDLDTLVKLPGVARKTANVVLGIAYGIPSGIAVDTHVSRVSQRLALTAEKNPEKVERALCELLDQDQWIGTGHRILLLGRYVCLAKNPDCANCPINELCPSRAADPLGPWEDRAAHSAVLVDARGA